MDSRIQRRWRGRTRRSASRVCAVVVAAVLVGGVLTVGAGATGSRTGLAASGDPAPACTLGNGVKRVIELTFDDAHFFRDNPDVPSDLELMPNLLNFIEQNGTLLSNSHTPLIANPASDALTTLTGLYGDRHGMPISNTYQSFYPDGTTDPASSFAYWTDPVLDTAALPSTGHDTSPSMVYSGTPPATTVPATTPSSTTPAPWVPFTGPGAMWARWERRISSSRAQETSRMRSGRTRPRRSSSARTRTRSRTRKWLTTLVSRFIARPVAQCARWPKP